MLSYRQRILSRSAHHRDLGMLGRLSTIDWTRPELAFETAFGARSSASLIQAGTDRFRAFPPMSQSLALSSVEVLLFSSINILISLFFSELHGVARPSDGTGIAELLHSRHGLTLCL